MRTSERAVWLTLGGFMMTVVMFRNEFPLALTVSAVFNMVAICWNLADEGLREEE